MNLPWVVARTMDHWRYFSLAGADKLFHSLDRTDPRLCRLAKVRSLPRRFSTSVLTIALALTKSLVAKNSIVIEGGLWNKSWWKTYFIAIEFFTIKLRLWFEIRQKLKCNQENIEVSGANLGEKLGCNWAFTCSFELLPQGVSAALKIVQIFNLPVALANQYSVFQLTSLKKFEDFRIEVVALSPRASAMRYRFVTYLWNKLPKNDFYFFQCQAKCNFPIFSFCRGKFLSQSFFCWENLFTICLFLI